MAILVDIHLIIPECLVMSKVPVIEVILPVCFIRIYEYEVIMQPKSHSI